jgi:hypothetical protein
VFVPGSSFQHNLLFTRKARAYFRVEHLKVTSLGQGAGLMHKQAGNACQEQTLELIANIELCP